jgi:putative transport protein
LFSALLAGHLGYSVPGEAGTLGLVLFVYCVGIGAGGRFLPLLPAKGATLAKLALIIVGTGGLITWAGASWMGLPADLATGIFAGALTSTPALAAATEALKESSSGVSIGYGIAYPFGVIGVVLFVQVLPRVLKHDLERVAERHASAASADDSVENVLVEVTNQNLFGKKIADSGVANFNACQVSRIFKSGQLVPLSYDDTFSEGQLLLLVGLGREIGIATD